MDGTHRTHRIVFGVSAHWSASYGRHASDGSDFLRTLSALDHSSPAFVKLSSLWKDILHIFLVYKVVKMLNSDSEEEEIVVVSCLLAEEEEQKVKKRKTWTVS